VATRKRSGPLTHSEVLGIKGTGKVQRRLDRDGLFLHVTAKGSKLWRFRYTFEGKDALCSLGSFPEVGLAEAREEVIRLRRLVRQGVRPSDVRKQAKRDAGVDPVRSYRAVAKRWVAEQVEHRSWRPSYLKQVVGTLEKEVFPVLGDKQFDQVTPTDFRDLLAPIRDRDAKTVAKLIQQWCVAIGHYGVLHGYAEVNTAASLRGFIKTKPKSHHKPLSEVELPVFFQRVHSGGGTELVRLAILLLAHTFVRPSELRCAVWSEFDLDGAMWVIPGNRMKKGREHKVPLTPQVLALLQRSRAMKLHKSLLFPNTRDRSRPMSPTTLNRYLERLGYGGKFSAHGFRATASTLLNSWGAHTDAIELQLAHVDKSLTRRSYNQAEYMMERTEIMQSWSDFLGKNGADPDAIQLVCPTQLA
jgi:integrase